MAVRIRFDATLQALSDLGEFPRDIVHTVILTNRDDCTHKIVPVSPDGRLSVTYDMEPIKAPLTDRMKLFYYFKNEVTKQLDPICAGHMTLTELAKMISDGGSHETSCNFKSNRVIMTIEANPAHGHLMTADLLERYKNNEITESVLSKSSEHARTAELLSNHIQQSLPNEMIVAHENGGTMFQSLETMHVMSGEKTLLPLYHLDFDQPAKMPPYLATYLMLATLHYTGYTIEQVNAMSGNQKTDFLAAYAQSPMRSAKAVPYTSDVTMTDDPRATKRAELSEVFKRPYSHPYVLGTLHADDCEGFASLIRLLVSRLAYMYKEYTPKFESDNILEYNSLMKECFPPKLFDPATVTNGYQIKLMKMMLNLGKIVAEDQIACAIVLGSANAASAQCTEQTSVMGHAYACMINKDPLSPYSVILEGTACMVDDQRPKLLKLGNRYVSVSDVANSISCSPTFNTFMEREYTTQIAMHITHDKSSFYRAAFLQNDTLLGTAMNTGPTSGHPGRENLLYGVDIEHLTNDSVKVYMPVMGAMFTDGEYQRLKEYVIARQEEIHPPLVDPKDLMTHLNWTPLTSFKGVDRLQASRRYTTLMVHVLATEEHPVNQLLARATKEAAAFNSDPENLWMGAMYAYPSMDGISKVLYLYTDDTTELEKRLVR